MAGMPEKLSVKRRVPAVGEDADTTKRIPNNGATPSLPDRDGPAKRKHPTPARKTSEPAKKHDLAAMKASLKKLG